PGLSSDGQSMPATARQRGDSFVSSQESHISGTAGAREPAGEGAGQTGAQAGGGDFAEWVFAEGSQDAGPVGASVGSLVHVAAGGLPPIGEDGKEEELDEAADEPPVAVAQATPVADATVGDASSNKADENTDLFNDVKFDDVFGTTSSAFEPQETEAKASNSSEQPAAAASIDLDSVFSIPRSTQQAQPTLGKTTSPATHHRSASLDNDQRSHASSSANDSDTEEAMEQSFRVKFSIRDRAIEDNPDESKAALSRVTTLLRAAPASARSSRRRDVRTMYVPSGLPITGGLELGTGGGVESPVAVATPGTPMPRRVENAHGGDDDDDDDDVVLAKVASPLGSARGSGPLRDGASAGDASEAGGLTRQPDEAEPAADEVAVAEK
ncbi:hypothetical protein GGI05_007297, partial [Coemansia sp. RSA 2603]